MGLGREGLERLLALLLRHLPSHAFLEEVTEFLGKGPQPAEIVAFHGSERSQERVRELLDKNRASRFQLHERHGQGQVLPLYADEHFAVAFLCEGQG